ncbi:MAG: deoxyguanosinetriphosphate triphosphohydrolase [Alphaproteobacteria bacterium]|nr:deoxyguanosinetriphosphate triphosphohydrolase [Alphaproteobacteria bacterium]
MPIMGVPAAFASDPRASRGRLHAEAESLDRNAFQRDRDRVIHSAAFRRLQSKTQVFVTDEGDNYRTRLTHSLEVAQLARTLARRLGLHEDLAEALALAHDLGHPPFGHAGEVALAEAMADYGGFDHNAQTLRVLTRLEQRYAAFDGLNLTWETLEGAVKHNGPLVPRPLSPGERPNLPATIADYNARHDLWLHSYASAEAQVAALADDIAYNNHDIDDGLRAGLFRVEDLAPLPLVGEVFAEMIRAFGRIEQSRLVHEAVRRLITRMLDDVVGETGRRVAAAGLRSADDVRALPQALVAFSVPMIAADRALRRFLFTRMYRHPKVMERMTGAQDVVKDLFRAYLADDRRLPEAWQAAASAATDPTARAVVIADFIAGMTDRFALTQHRALQGPAA